ncbi:chromate transporter [Trinickia dinghuensis]|uniref:Chromate transporter n=1 Tax=Trinickia dinghuensis TaxID=2291023 RepID=A0A3D8JZV6_9BURK|nr:chromate transporter [Trinickia dinghuensis]RDU98186.1 chromate transporter [Trinickia dinghuensis]
MDTALEAGAAKVSLRDIVSVFARVGLTSFGGGLSAWIYREAVTERGWLSNDEFLGALTLGQIVPGSNVVNLSIYIGYRLRGALGSVLAAASLLLPPMVVIVVFALMYRELSELVWLHRFLEGVAAAAVGMTASVGVRSAKKILSRQRVMLVPIVAVLIAIGILRWPLVPVALVVGAAGLTLAYGGERRAR